MRLMNIGQYPNYPMSSNGSDFLGLEWATWAWIAGTSTFVGLVAWWNIHWWKNASQKDKDRYFGWIMFSSALDAVT